MKIKIWIPTHDQRVTAKFALEQWPLEVVELLKRGWSFGPCYSSSCDLNGMRNSALQGALDEGYDFLIMQDSDVSAEPCYAQLIDTCLEHEATACVAAVGLRQMERDRIRMNVLPFKVDEVFEVERAGTGIIAIDLKKLTQITEEYDGPWFWREYKDKRCTEQKIGQDIFFTYLVRSLDGKVMCDSRIETNHPHINNDHLNYVPAIVKTVVSG